MPGQSWRLINLISSFSLYAVVNFKAAKTGKYYWNIYLSIAAAGGCKRLQEAAGGCAF